MKKKNLALLNIFLVKEEFQRRDQIINQDSCKAPIDIPISGHGKGKLFLKPNPPKPPKWSSFFSDAIDASQIGKASSIAAAFLLKVKGRFFVLTFGQGRFLIKDDVFEERFGLLVTLNSVNKESLRCIDKQSLDTIESHTRTQSGHETTADQFGIDVEQDMLRAIVGTPKDSKLGNRMSGADSLSVTVPADLSDLPYLLNSYKDKFEEDLSKTDYQWVNNISTIKSTSLISSLEKALLEKFKNKDYTNLWLSIPEIIDWTSVAGFTYTNGKKVIHPDITLEGFLGTINKDQPITLELIKNRRVCCADADHNKIFNPWPIYKCLYAEIDIDGSKCIFNNGKWFKINNDFVERTDNDFDKIEYSKLVFPDYAGGGENKYNKYVAKCDEGKYTVLDAKNIFHGGSHGQVEVCDLFSTGKHLIHVKLYSKSSVLSHLFSQGYVSGRLIQLDKDFRKKFKKKLKKPFDNLINVDSRPDDKEYTIVFAITSELKGGKLHLPFFSRVNLNNVYKTLNGYGFNVKLLKINVDETYAKTKKCPAQKKSKI